MVCGFMTTGFGEFRDENETRFTWYLHTYSWLFRILGNVSMVVYAKVYALIGYLMTT